MRSTNMTMSITMMRMETGMDKLLRLQPPRERMLSTINLKNLKLKTTVDKPRQVIQLLKSNEHAIK